MGERRYNAKKFNCKHIYAQIAKYGKLISELAEEHNMEEEAFLARIEKGLEPKLFSNAVKADRNNKKNRQSIAKRNFVTVNEQEDTDMAKRNQQKLDEKYRNQQSTQDKAKQKQKVLDIHQPTLEELEDSKTKILDDISKKESSHQDAIAILEIREKAVIETQKVLEEAQKALEVSIAECEKAKNTVSKKASDVKSVKAKLETVEAQIAELKNKKVYLVAPGFAGEKPKFGTFYSTETVVGFSELQVITDINNPYDIEPDFKDMVIAGYDSVKDYSAALRFILLCVEYTFNDIDYDVLVSDEKIEKLLKAHLG